MVGWIFGDLLASLYIHKKLRVATESSGELSYAGVLSHWYSDNNQVNLQRVIGLIGLVFLLAYSAAQLVAGGKALNVLLDLPIWSGAFIGAFIIAAYCVAGGIRASIWTDAAQSIVMLLSMAILLIVALNELGGFAAAKEQLDAIPSYMNWRPTDLAIPGVTGGILFAVSWIFAGFSVIGQPHIMVRFMALDSPTNFTRARIWYYVSFTIFYAMATGVGLLAKLFFTDSNFDSEIALPLMAQQLLPEFLVGVILAGIFAATISTADSLVLSSSAAITNDLFPSKIENTKLIKLTTIVTVILALGWALLNKESVFSLVILAWSGLASAFAPLLIILSFGGRPSEKQGIAVALTGLLVALCWRYLGWHAYMYEGMPGICAALLMYLGMKQFTKLKTETES
jgi:sodium/proline symporter